MKKCVAVFIISLFILSAGVSVFYSNNQSVLDEGVSFFLKEQYYEAISRFRTALKVNPYYAEAYYYLAMTYYQMEQYQISLDNIEKAIKYQAGEPDFYKVKANIFRETGRYEEAEEIYLNLLDQYPAGWDYARNTGLLYLKMNQLEKAKKMLENAYRMNSGVWKTSIALAYYYYETENFEQAEKYYKQAYSQNPRERMVYYELADFYYKLGRYEEATALLESGRKLFSNFFYGINLLNQCYIELNQYRKAAEGIDWMIDNTQSGEVKVLAELYYERAYASSFFDQDVTLEYYRKASETDPSNELYAFSLEEFVIKNQKIDSAYRQVLSDQHFQEALGLYQQGVNFLYYYHLKRSIQLYPYNTKSRKELIRFYEDEERYGLVFRELQQLVRIDHSLEIKDRYESYQWKISKNQINVEPVQKVAFPGLIILQTRDRQLYDLIKRMLQYYGYFFDRIRLEPVLVDDFSYNLDEIIRKMDETGALFYITLSRKRGMENHMQISLNNNKADEIDRVSMLVEPENISVSSYTMLKKISSYFPDIYKIGEKRYYGSYQIQAGVNQGLLYETNYLVIDLSGEYEMIAEGQIIEMGPNQAVFQPEEYSTVQKIDLNGKYLILKENYENEMYHRFIDLMIR